MLLGLSAFFETSSRVLVNWWIGRLSVSKMFSGGTIFFFFLFFWRSFVSFEGLESNPAAESFFRDFLSFALPLGTYMDRVRNVVAEGRRRVVVNMDDLRAFDAQVWELTSVVLLAGF